MLTALVTVGAAIAAAAQPREERVALMLASTLAVPCRFTAPRSGHTYDFTSLVRPPGQDYAMPDAGQPDMRFQYHYNFCGGVESRPSGGNQDLGVQVSLAVHHMHHTTFFAHTPRINTTMRHLPSTFVFTRCPPHAPHAHAPHAHATHTHMQHTRHFMPTSLTINTTCAISQAPSCQSTSTSKPTPRLTLTMTSRSRLWP